MLPEAVAGGGCASTLCAVMRLEGVTFPACPMLGPGESRPRRRIVEVVIMLVLQDPACAAAVSGLPPERRTRNPTSQTTRAT